MNNLKLLLKNYIFLRIGRTGRLGNTGESISFYDDKTNGGICVDLVKGLMDAEQVKRHLNNITHFFKCRICGSKQKWSFFQ